MSVYNFKQKSKKIKINLFYISLYDCNTTSKVRYDIETKTKIDRDMKRENKNKIKNQLFYCLYSIYL